jgi:DinB family protein
MTTITDPLDDLRPNRSVEVAPAILRSRESFTGCIDDILAVPDASLEDRWRWRPNDEDDADVRYGLYRIHEVLEEAIARIARDGATSDKRIALAVPRLATATTARWELRGALAGFEPDTWDADPGNAEWSVRRTVGHVVGTQRRYNWGTAWYVSRRGSPDEGRPPPEGVVPPDPDEDAEAEGSPADVLARFDALVDAAAERFADLDEAGLQTPARWSGLPVTVDFRLGRFGSHMREHTIQIDKTLVMVGRSPSEAQRLARLACQAFGRLEATAFARTAGKRAAIVEEAATDVAALAASVRSAAGG